MMLAYQPFRALFLLFSLPFLVACSKPKMASENARVSEGKTTENTVPEWLQKKIETYKAEKPSNPPIKLFSYNYQGQTVYFITSRCCDIPSEVYTVEGQQLCQPDGGITGKGDGKCVDFYNARTDEKLIWEDLRK